MNDFTNKHSLFSPIYILLFLVLFMMLGTLIGSFLAYGIAYLNGVDLMELEKLLIEENSPRLRNAYRTMVMVQHLCLFLFPAALAAWLFYRNSAGTFLKLNSVPKGATLFFSFLFLMAAFPFASWMIWPGKWLAENLPASIQWIGAMEEDSMGLIEIFLTMESPWELLLTLLVMGVAPALGEELLFRGIVQQEFKKWFGNPHIAIVASAFLFSCTHFQLQRFFSIWILGMLLGYLFYWTKNLWVPIIVHFFNNGFQVLVAYKYPGELEVSDLEKAGEIPVWALLISFIFVPLFANLIRKQEAVSK